jgi:NitT/TauT family transport system substrate-binding protein
VSLALSRRARFIAVGAIIGLIAGVGLSALAPAGASTRHADDPVELRLGYFPNVTHATAIVGVEAGIFQKALGPNVDLKTSTFNAGPAASEALLSGAIDATYIGPNPSINAFIQSNGEAVRIISGATSGGAFFVVNKDIKTAKDLKGKKIATPQLGNTQDVALRTWLKSKGLKTDASGGGDVSILPQDNATSLQAFESGDIDGAWVPEPYATRLVKEGGGHILVDERDLWPGGKYVTTDLLVAKSYLDDHPEVIQRLLEGQVEANDFVNKNTADAEGFVVKGISNITGKAIPADQVAASFKTLTFTNDPIASSLFISAKHAKSVGLLDSTDLKGIYDLKLLNKVLKAKGLPPVSAK